MLSLALVLLAALQSEETVSYGNVIVRVPEGWQYEKKTEGLFLRPGDLKKGEGYVVIIPPGGKAEGNLAEEFEKAWKRAAGDKKIVKKAPGREMKTEGGADGLMSVGLLDTPDGTRLLTAVAVFRCGERSEAVLALSAQDLVFQRQTESFGALLKGLRFKNTELPGYDLLLTMGYTEKEGKTSVYVLFKDGTWLATFPPEGLDDLDAAEARKRFGESCGTHETKDRILTLRRGSEVETLKPANDGWYRSENGVYQPLRTSTGLRFEGKYLVHGDNEGKSFTFRADGGYGTSGAIASLPDLPATGAYEILNNTIWLTSTEGKTRKVSFAMLPKAGDKNPEFILLGGKWLRRE